MNLLASRSTYSNRNDVFEYAVPSESSPATLDLVKNNDTRISQMIDFSNQIEEVSDLNNIRIVNSNSLRDIYINPPGNVGMAHLSIGNNVDNVITSLSGVIATKGDVYFYVPDAVTLNFNGLISAEGRVIFYGPGTKNINKDRELTNYQIAAYTDLGNAFLCK